MLFHYHPRSALARNLNPGGRAFWDSRVEDEIAPERVAREFGRRKARRAYMALVPIGMGLGVILRRIFRDLHPTNFAERQLSAIHDPA